MFVPDNIEEGLTQMNFLQKATSVIYSQDNGISRCSGLIINIDHFEEDYDEIEIIGEQDESLIIPKDIPYDEEECTFYGDGFTLELIF